MSDELNFVERARRDKLDAIAAGGGKCVRLFI